MSLLFQKKHLFFTYISLFPAIGIAQTQTSRTVMSNPVHMSGNEFNIYQKSGGGDLGAFSTSPSGDIKGSQFFLPDWSNGEVVTTRKDVYNENLQFIYDKVRQELFVRKKDSLPVLLTNKDEVQSFSLRDKNNRQYNFVNSKSFNDDRPEVFYQVLIYDSSKLSLFKYIKTSFVRGDPTDMMKQEEGAVYDEFVDKNTFYLIKGMGQMKAIQLKPKSIKKVLEDFHINYETDSGPIDEAYLIDMVKQLNK
jgi:hypothetical protein